MTFRAYITCRTQPGRTGAERNCISNIRSQALNLPHAAAQIAPCLVTASKPRLTATAVNQSKSLLPDHLVHGGRP
jgi:ethanolamine ammonia-lyase small subunit